MTTGQRIKAARKKAGLTQAELAKKLDDIPFQSISQWERDLRNPKYETLVRIATALKVDWTELVPEEKQAQVVIDHIREGMRGEEQKNNPSPDGNGLTPVQKEAWEIVSQMSDEQLEQFIRIAKAVLNI